MIFIKINLHFVRYSHVFFVIFILNVCLTSNTFSNDNQQSSFQWKIGEELNYRVKWLSFTVGTIKSQIVEKDSLNGRPVYHCRTSIDSNPSLPFVDLHEVYDSYIDEDLYSHAFNVLIKKADYNYLVFHDIDYTRKEVRIVANKCTETDTSVIMDSTIVIHDKIQDGTSVLYYSRAMSDRKIFVEAPVLNYKQIKPAQIIFKGKRHSVKLKDENLPGYYVEGLLKFVGIGGVKDDFRGWFSADAQRVPLEAEMKASLGSIKIELESWKNWNPFDDTNDQLR